jgi:hypothetical protein
MDSTLRDLFERLEREAAEIAAELVAEAFVPAAEANSEDTLTEVVAA